MTDAKQINPDAFAALQTRFQAQSRKAQAYYTAMHAIGNVLKSEAAASAWMEAPLAALGGATPAEAVRSGRAQEVIDHIAALRS